MKNYNVYINGKLKESVDTPDEVWEVIGNSPFGSLYEVESPTGKSVLEFIPF